MEAASFRKYWRTKVFVVCGISILKLKMWIYIIFTSIIGIGLLVVTGLFHGQLINLDYSNFLSGLTITECGTVGSLVKNLHQANKCCGLTMNSTTCGQWANSITDSTNCGCTVGVDGNNCELVQTAENNYNCQIDSGLSTTGIYTVGCQSVVISTYFEGFGVLYGLGYGIGLCLALCGVFGFMIALWGKTDHSVKPSSEDESTFKGSN